MLKLFAGRPDHPMADPRQARRILEELPANDPLRAIEELAHWHESVAATEGFRSEQRIQVLSTIDEAAQPRLRKLAKDYFAATRPSRFQENRMWTHLHEYCKQAGRAYARCVDGVLQGEKGAETARPLLPLLVVRALRSLGQQIKWMHLRYGPVDPAAWGVLNKVYAFAETRGIADSKVTAYPGLPGEASPRQEFLKAAMFSASSPDSLLPQEAELAERVTGDFASSFTLAAAAAPELPYWTDLGQPMAPLRFPKAPAPAPGLRWLGAGAALGALQALIQRIEAAGEVPAGMNLGGSNAAETALGVMRHLAVYWSPLPPERRHPRHSVKSRLAIAHGFDGVLEALGGASESLDFDKRTAESWIADNVSAGGFGAMVPQIKSDWLKVGTLLAMQPEGGSNWLVGMVRRVNKVSNQEARVGIQTLSRSPAVSKFALRGVGEEHGVLLAATVPGSGEAAIALRAGVYAPGQNLEAEIGGRQHVYLPRGLAERGEDYEIVRFREMVRES